MTINDQIANEIIMAEAEDKSLREWGEVIDNFVFNKAEEMTFGWDLEDEEFDSFKDSLKEAIMAHVDLNKVQGIVDETTEQALDKINDIFERKRDWGWK